MWALLAALEGVLVLLALILYKGWSHHRGLLAVSLAGCLAAGTGLLRLYSLSDGTQRRVFQLTLAMNLLSLVLLVLVGEAVVRIGAVPGPQGMTFMNRRLVPREWQAVVAANRDLLRNAPGNISYFVSDPLLGWTVGASRTSKDGLYMSSREGIRSAAAGTSYVDRPPSPRIAIVGDSFTFGLEVPYEASWGDQLERKLGSPVQVLNFGVDGYGVDQAYLRYHRDVRPWRPILVVLGFINDDLYRTLVVYPIISFPDWGFPFAKPRFVLSEDRLNLLNVPLPDPERLLAVESVDRLPYVDYDPGFVREEWQHLWYHRSSLVRLLLALFPRWPEPSSQEADGLRSNLNAEILRVFVEEVIAEGAVPLLVYFPSRGDFTGNDRAAKTLLFDVLRKKSIGFEDLTPCMGRVDPAVLFLEGRVHYSPEGNAVAADCLLPRIRQALDQYQPVP